MDGLRFLELEVSNLHDASIDEPMTASDWTLILKYAPRTGDWGATETCQVTLTPNADPDKTVERHQVGAGTARFRHADWAYLPTMHHVVSALAALPIIESRGASVTHSRGGKSYGDQRVVR